MGRTKRDKPDKPARTKRDKPDKPETGSDEFAHGDGELTPGNNDDEDLVSNADSAERLNLLAKDIFKYKAEVSADADLNFACRHLRRFDKRLTQLDRLDSDQLFGFHIQKLEGLQRNISELMLEFC